MSHATDTATRKKFRIKENRKGTTKLESIKLLCISMEGKSEKDARRLLDMLSSIGFRWGSGHELWEHDCHKGILDRSCWIILHIDSWCTSHGSYRSCQECFDEDTITLEHLEVLIEDFLYEHHS